MAAPRSRESSSGPMGMIQECKRHAMTREGRNPPAFLAKRTGMEGFSTARIRACPAPVTPS